MGIFGKLTLLIYAVYIVSAPTTAKAVDIDPIDQLTIYVPGNPEGGFDKTGQSIRRTLTALSLAGDVDIIRLPGAGGLIALANFTESQKGKTNTIFVGGRTTIGATIFNNSALSLNDTVPIARLTKPEIAIAVNIDSPIKDFGDLVEVMSAKADSVKWFGGSSASVDEMVIMEMADELGIARQSVRYFPTPGGGKAAIERFLAQENAVSVSSYEEIYEYVAQNKARIVAVSGASGITGLNAPSLSQLGLRLSTNDWRGIFAPPGLSAAERAKLEALFAHMIASDIWLVEAQRYGWQNAWLTGASLQKFLIEENQSVRAYSQKKQNASDALSDKLVAIMVRQYQWAIMAAILALGLLTALLWQRHRNAMRENSLTGSLDEARKDAQRALAKLEKSRNGVTDHINDNFVSWKLTPVETEIGWMLLKGLSFKEIANARGKSERTVRQQARVIYAKSGLDNRSGLAAYFLEDFFSNQIQSDS